MKASFLLLAFALNSGCRSGAVPGRASGTLLSRAELEVELDRAAQTGAADGVWARILATGPMPIVFGHTAEFFYRGPGEVVEWRGEFSEWWPSWDTLGSRVGTTDLWRKTIDLLPGSRLDYTIFVDGKSQLDPNNPYQQVGGYGPNSEARMPEWRPSPYVTRGPNTPRGAFSANLALPSRHLGYSVNYRVYLPPGLPAGAQDLPTLFVTDGSDYYRDEMGAMVIVLDRLYEEALIDPIVVVFVDPWDDQHQVNRRKEELIPKPDGACPFCDFLVQELIPQVAAAYPTTQDSARRGLLGVSYGGLHAAWMGLSYPKAFGMIGMQSPAFHPPAVRFVLERMLQAEQFPRKVFLDVGRYERRFLFDSETAAEHLRALGVDLLLVEPPGGHSWGHWREYFDEVLVHFFGRSEGPVAPRSAL